MKSELTVISVVLALCVACSPPIPEPVLGNDTDDTDDTDVTTDTDDTDDTSIDTDGSEPIDADLGGTVTSPDGVLTLTIPPGALASDTVITIEAVAEADWAAGIAETAPIGTVYAVGPEGTVFSEPATFTWTFDAPPASVVDGDGKITFLAAMSRADDGTIAAHDFTSAGVEADGSLLVLSENGHLSAQWLTAQFGSQARMALGDADLGARRQAIEVPWLARDILIEWFDTFSTTAYAVAGVKSGPIVLVPTTDWPLTTPPDGPPFTEFHEPVEAVSAEVWTPNGMPSWKCTEPGNGVVTVTLTVSRPDASSLQTRFLQDIECVARTVKSEYANALEALPGDGVEPLAATGSDTVVLDDHAGAYGYTVEIPPGRTVRICVSTTGSAGIMQYPKYPPGFDYVDVQPQGCTEITNLDADLANTVLVVITGDGTATITTELLPP
jgi:hypothetical protein